MESYREDYRGFKSCGDCRNDKRAAERIGELWRAVEMMESCGELQRGLIGDLWKGLESC